MKTWISIYKPFTHINVLFTRENVRAHVDPPSHCKIRALEVMKYYNNEMAETAVITYSLGAAQKK